MSRKRTERIQLVVRRFDVSSLPPCNVLIVGPSQSRKSALIVEIAERFASGAPVVLHTNQPEAYAEDEGLRATSIDDPSPELAFRAARAGRGVCIVENPRAYNQLHLDPSRKCFTISALPTYDPCLPSNCVELIDYVMVLGGTASLRNIWTDFGAVIPVYSDFLAIYKACTSEGDRYSDDYLVLRVDRTTSDPNDIVFRSTLAPDPVDVTDITLTVKRFAAEPAAALQATRVPVPQPQTASEHWAAGGGAQQAEKPTAAKEGASLEDADQGDEEGDEEGDCRIL